jgi:hypothetical protein
MKDFAGNELTVEDEIAYATHHSSSTPLRKAFVLKVESGRVRVRRQLTEHEQKRKAASEVWLSSPQSVVKIFSRARSEPAKAHASDAAS